MKKQVLFVQGAGDGAYEEDAKLAESLRQALGPGYDVRYPRMPDEGEPEHAAWARRLAEEIAAMGDGAIVVGHSAGASSLVRFLAESPHQQEIAGIFLIATPFCGEGGWELERFALPADLGRRLPRATPVHLYHGDKDEIVPFAHLALYARALPHAAVHALPGRTHQLGEDLSVVADDIRRLV